jgi:hypothetical protein
MARYKERTKSIVEATVLTFPILFECDGEQVTAGPGDFLITEADGTQFVMDSTEFNEKYEPLKRPAGTGTGRRGRPKANVESQGDSRVLATV